MSNFVGSCTSFMKPASMMTSWYSIPGCSSVCTFRAQRRRRPSDIFMMSALWSTVGFLAASLLGEPKAQRLTRVHAASVATLRLVTTPLVISFSMPL